ncbi:CAP domain-containing protein [Streptomyces sp. NPDC046831]|uniref:CAP domain-containing protein n=1 Tax=Streptomyces sp. NPDC046831 TaxID=3154805 RepID=UPI0033C0AEF8
MGRHRRSDAGRAAATGRATGVTEAHGFPAQDRDPWDSYPADRPVRGIAPYLNPEAYADSYARSQEYLYAPYDDQAQAAETVVFPETGFSPSEGARAPGHRRKRKAATPVRSGLLGVSAAVALGTVAVATGTVPGLENYKLGGGTSSGGDSVQAGGSPTNTDSPQGGTSGSVDGRAGGSSTSRDADRSASATPSAPASASPSASASAAPSATPTKPPAEQPTDAPEKPGKPQERPTGQAPKAPGRSGAPAGSAAQAAAEAEVLRLVNEERAKAGLAPVSASSALTDLAEDFSQAMATQDFFDHTDPSGASPWDRAAKAGVTGLGGENIARGQADAAAVMEAWMNSPGHRANILNPDFKTLGVGVHLGPGGPWWTQDFGY